MKVLVINAGSSSIKYKLFEMGPGSVLAAGVIERIGEQDSQLTHKTHPGTKSEKDIKRPGQAGNHQQALTRIIALLTDSRHGVLDSLEDVAAVGHRIVHGGVDFQTPEIVDTHVLERIQANIPLAPLHNPAHLAVIKQALWTFKATPQVVVFDTAFHQSMPDKAFHYAIPYDLYQELNIRRYGFHGISHQYVAKQAARLLGQEIQDINLITVHLGNGSSMAAIKGGSCVDTSMGMTPLTGLVMGTRCGDIDPAVHYYLHLQKGMGCKEIDNLLNHESGLKGICGLSDLRDIHAARHRGDQRAQLALDLLTYRNKKYFGSYIAILGKVDGIVFTAGIGENDPEVRYQSLTGMQDLGIHLDQDKNETETQGPRFISSPDSQVKVMVIPTDEELEIAQQCLELIGEKDRG